MSRDYVRMNHVRYRVTMEIALPRRQGRDEWQHVVELVCRAEIAGSDPTGPEYLQCRQIELLGVE